MRYSHGDSQEEPVSTFMRGFLELKNKKEELLRSSGLLHGNTQTSTIESKISKHEEELKAAYLIKPENNENIDPNSSQNHKILSHYTDEDDEVEGEDGGES